MYIKVKSFAECEDLDPDLWCIPEHVLRQTASTLVKIDEWYSNGVLIGHWLYPFEYLELPLFFRFDEAGRLRVY